MHRGDRGGGKPPLSAEGAPINFLDIRSKTVYNSSVSPFGGHILMLRSIDLKRGKESGS